MKKLILFFILFFVTNVAISHSGWFWQNPYPVGSHLEDCYFINENIGYAVGWDGVIIKTTNGGDNWTQQNSGGNRILTSVFFTNPSVGYVTSGDESFNANNILLKTTNGGVNWIPIFSFDDIHLSDIYFLNDSIGYIAGGKYWSAGRVYKTTNSGVSWSLCLSIQYSFMYSIFFTSVNTGYVAGDDGKIIKTTNSGVNWIPLNSGNSNVIFQAIYFTSNEIGYVVGSSGQICKTTNAGNNWSFKNSGTQTDLWDIVFTNVNIGYIAAGCSLGYECGKVLKTTNAKETWDSIYTGNYHNLRSIFFDSSNTIVGVGYWGSVIKSTNLGNNWTFLKKTFYPGDLNNVSFVNDYTGYITAGNGTLLRTTDSGINWDGVLSGYTYYHLSKSHFLNINTGFVIGTSGLVLRSTNGGINWVKQNSGTSYSLNDIDFINNLTGYIVSDTFDLHNQSYGKILKTTDAGLSWTTQLHTVNRLFHIEFCNSITRFVMGNANNRIFKSTNGGSSWFFISVNPNYLTNDIYFLNNNIGYISGVSSLIKTTNSGNNWFAMNIFNSYEFHVKSICFTNSVTGYLACTSFPYFGRSGDIFKTTDGGFNWNRFSSIFSYPTCQRFYLNSVYFLNNNTGFVIGEKGTILKTTNGGNTINIKNIQITIPNGCFLHQNYPNPFNPTTNIRFDVPVSSHVKLIVYDALGREVAILVNEKLNEGSYETVWNGSGYPSGVYFYRVETNDFIETKKMMLVK